MPAFLISQIEGAIEKTLRDDSMPAEVKTRVVTQLQLQLSLSRAAAASPSKPTSSSQQRVRKMPERPAPRRAAMSPIRPPNWTPPPKPPTADLERFVSELQGVNKRLSSEVALKRTEVATLARRNKEMTTEARSFSVKERQRARELDAMTVLVKEAREREDKASRRAEANATRTSLLRQQLSAAKTENKALQARNAALSEAHDRGVEVLATHNAALNESDTALRALVSSRQIAERTAVEQEQRLLEMSEKVEESDARVALLSTLLTQARESAADVEDGATAMREASLLALDEIRRRNALLEGELGAARQALRMKKPLKR